MACCAFAVFLLAQLLAPFRILGGRLGLFGPWQPDAAVIWQPGVASALPAKAARPARSWTQLLLVVLVFDIALLGVFRLTGVAADLPRIFAPDTPAARFEEALHSSICGPDSRRR